MVLMLRAEVSATGVLLMARMERIHSHGAIPPCRILFLLIYMAQNDPSGQIAQEQKWYPLQRLNALSCHLEKIQSAPALGQPVCTSPLQPIIVVTMPGLVETFKRVIKETTYGTNFKLVNLEDVEYGNLTHENLDTCIDKLDNQWNIHVVLSDTSTSKVQPL